MFTYLLSYSLTYLLACLFIYYWPAYTLQNLLQTRFWGFKPRGRPVTSRRRSWDGTSLSCHR